MNDLIYSLNKVLANWKREYDIFSVISAQFSDEKGFISFGGQTLFPLSNGLVLESAEFDAERIEFFLSEKRSITLNISWPEDLPPVVSSVLYVCSFGDEAP